MITDFAHKLIKCINLAHDFHYFGVGVKSNAETTKIEEIGIGYCEMQRSVIDFMQ